MKYLVGLLSVFFSQVLLAQVSSTVDLKTDVSAVTVYLQNAMETRVATLNVPSGKTQLRLVGLSPNIEKKSIQAKVDGGVTLLNVSHQINYLDKLAVSPEKKALQDKLADVEKQLATETALVEVIQDDLDYLKANRTLGGEKLVDLSLVRQGAVFFNEKVTALKMKRLDRIQSQTTLNKLRTDLLAQLSELQTKSATSTGEILLLVDASKNTSVKVTLSYLVNNAGWYPSYDIRANSINAPLEIVYKANIWQKTKTDWKNVKLKLSSSNPTISGVAPELEPYRLSFWEPDPVDIVMLHSSARQRIDVVEERLVDAQDYAGGASALAQVENPQALAVDFTIQMPLSIVSDGKVQMVDMDRLSMAADYQYFAIPKLSSDVYLKAQFSEWEKYSFLNGEANVFFEGSFVGTTVLNIANATDTLSISLGVDKRISVKREKVKDYISKQVLGSKKTDTREWKTVVRNNRTEAINLLLVDQLPLSTSSDIEVSNTVTPSAAIHSETGEVHWFQTLKPGQDYSFDLKYSVKYPKNKRLNLE